MNAITHDYTQDEASHSPSLIEVAVTIAELLPFDDPTFSFRTFIQYVLEEIDRGASNEEALKQAAHRVIHESYSRSGNEHEDQAFSTIDELFATT